MTYDFQRYVNYLSAKGLDAVIASNYDVTARMLGRYFKDDMWMSVGLREYNPLVGCDKAGELICARGTVIEQAIGGLAAILRERGLERASIGLEMLDFPARGLQFLQESLPDARFVDASWVIHQDLARKTDAEIRLIERCVEACEAGFQNVVAHMRECVGRPLSDLMWLHFAPEVLRHGVELLGSNVSGHAWERREGETEPVVLEGGEPINFDIICGYQGLLSDIAFRAVVGEPDSAFAERFEASILVVDALVKSIRPGMTAAEAEGACLDNMAKAVGSWDGYWAVHCTGFHVHEFPQIGSPYVGKFGDHVFEEGNVLSVEAIAEQMFVLRSDGLHRLGQMPMQIYRA